jgi:hypothetical protein
MREIDIFAGLIQCCVRYPIWFFLLFTVLNAIHPDRLVWFLFWVYLSLGLLIALVQAVVEVIKKLDNKK